MSKNNASSRANKGKTGYNTPHRWATQRTEAFKRRANTKVSKFNSKFSKPW